MKNQVRSRRGISFLLTFLMVVGLFGFIVPSYAAAGDVPDHDKILSVNDDGTYTIALNVKGDSEKDIQKVNVIVIVDRSNSMDTQSGTGAYVPTASTGTGLYGLIDGEYVPLTRQEGPGNRTFWYNGVQYTGQRYQYDGTATRMQATISAVDSLADNLFGYNGQDGNPDDTVEMALVTFGTTATTNVSPTTSFTTFSNAVNGLNANGGGTNWEAALRQANGISFGDNDPTFVIFFSDGSPTFRTTQAGYNDQYQTGVYGTGQEQEPNMQRSYDNAIDDATTLANKVGVKNFYTIFAYGTTVGASYMTDLTTNAGAPAENNYSASNTAELKDAFDAILESIEMAGIGAVSINDGTTSSVTTTTGEISNLLTVDTTSYKYYRAGGTDDSGNEKYDSNANGGLGETWADAPTAAFVDGAVKWDLSSEGVLENDVTYTVTFDCWPSQTTLDIVADIKNDPSSYDELDANIKKYIDKDGNLKTNTSASLTYTDTRTGQSGSTEYENPDPVETTAVEQLAISKKWENTLDGQNAEPITLTVTRDGVDKYTVDLSNDNNWTDSVFISIGIIRGSGSNVEVLEKGHDFTFVEPEDLGYYWELEVPTIRPMLINNTLTMLILKGDAPFDNPEGTTEYTIDGKTYYVGDTGEASLTATNHRRARLNLTKVVDGEDADPDQKFRFTLNVVDSKASEGSASDLNSDYYVWFSVYNGGFVDALVSGAEKEMKNGAWTGYYYAPSGSDIVVDLKAGDGLRFLNLPSDSTYTFTEGTLPANYAFTSSELTSGEDSTFNGAQTTTGTIEKTNTDYTVTYTNTYALTDIEITKEWIDNDDQDGIRPTAEEFKAYLVLKADGTDVTSSNADKLTVVDNGNGTYTVKWTGLDRYAAGKEIKYTVEEAEIEGYETEGSPAEDKGTITNTHEPEVTEITVKKVWEDSDDIGKIRPSSINVQLTADGAASGDPQVLNESNEWTYTWENLPKYKDGEEIVYSADETAVPAGYEKTGPEKTTADDGSVTFTITNTYNPTPVSVDPPVYKEITGTEDLYNKGNFTFTIKNDEAPDGVTAPMPENTSITNSPEYELSDKKGYYEFGEITFTVPGTYKYSVTESGNVSGVTNDEVTTKAIIFTVTDDGTGKLTVSPTTDEAVFSFTNVYDASGSEKIEVVKALVGADWPEGKTLTFTISGEGSAPMPESTTATLTSEGTVTFDIDYTLADAGKTYTYTIDEDGFGGAWTKSGPVTATVTIDDAGDGTLNIEVTYSDDNNVITNTYAAEGNATIEVTKAVAGAEWPSGKTLEFTLSGTDVPMPDTVTATLSAPGKVSFGPISYDEKDVGKTYTYTVSEDGFGTGWTSSGDVTATVSIEDNGDGTLKTTVSYSPANAIITNTYKASGSIVLKASKELVGREWADGETVTFTLLGPDGAKIEDKTIGENGTIEFSEIEYDESDAGEEYEYTISETSTLPGGVTKSEDIKAKVTVTDNGDGTLSTSVEYTENDKIINTYTTDPVKAQINVSKEISGYIPGEDPNGNVVDRTFNFTMTGPKIDGELTATITTVNGKGGPVSFDEIEFTFGDMVDDNGEHVTEKQFTYEVKETAGSDPGYTYASDTYTVIITVADDQNGHLEIKDITKVDDKTNVNVVNEFVEKSVDVQLHLTKVIEDQSDSAKDATFTFQLKDAEGNVVEEKTITTSGLTGSVDFTPINFTESGTYNYTLQEIAPVSSGDDTSDDSGKSETATPDSSETVEEPQDTSGAQDVTETTEDAPAGEVTTEETTEATGAQDVTETTEDTPAGEVTTEETTEAIADDASKNKEEEQNTKVADTKAADSDSGSGWTYDTKEYPVTITITDNFETAQLEATVDIDGTETTTLTVTNIYKAASTETTIEVYKEIDDKSGSAYETTFEFTLKDSDGKELGVKTITGPGKVSFDAISYEKAGTYNYTIKETEGDAAGYTYDTTEYPVVVTVEDVEGKLVATVDYGQVDSTELTVTNIYDPKDAEATPQARKVVDDKSGSAPDETFEFQLLDSDGEVVETVTKENGGYVYFSTLTFDTVGTYTYTIKEVSGNTAGFTYDTEGRDLEIVVTDEGKGSLVAEIEYLTDEGEAVITNEYKAEPTSVKFDVTKVVEGLGEGAEPVDFTFTLTDSDGKAVQTITITGSGTAEFDEIKYEKAGTYEYTITEKNDGAPGYTYDGSQYTVKVTVTDNGGKLVADKKITKDGEDTDKITFTNTYEAEPSEVEFNAKKTLVGRDLKVGEFEFVLEIDGEVVETVKNTAAGDVTFSTVKFDEPGTHTFKIYEVKGDLPNVTYDKTVYEGTITVTDNGQGQLEVEVEGNKDIKFINNYENITPPPPPKTGDNSNLTMWLILMSVALIGIAGLVIFVRRRSRE